jgi:hypothetical protein
MHAGVFVLIRSRLTTQKGFSMLKRLFQSLLISSAQSRFLLARMGVLVLVLTVLLTGSLVVASPSVHAQAHNSMAADLGKSTSIHLHAQHVGADRIDIFGVSASRTLTHRVYENNTLSGQEDLGGSLTSAPAAVAWTSTVNGISTVVSVFARNANKSISYRSLINGTWTPWIDLGGVNFSSAPSVTSDGPNDIEMVARGSDNSMYMKTLTNSVWGSWSAIGGVNFSTGPAIASGGPGQWEVYARGSNGELYRKIYTNRNGSAWVDQGIASIDSIPMAVCIDPGANLVINLVTITASGSPLIAIRRFTSAGNSELGSDSTQGITPDLAVASWQYGHADLFYRAADGTLMHSSITEISSNTALASTGWANLGGNSVENYAVAGW